MQRNLVLRKRLGEDVRGHIFSGAVLDVNVPVGSRLSNKMVADIDVFGASVIIVLGGQMECGLIIAVEGGGGPSDAEEGFGQPPEPDTLLGRMGGGDVFGLGGG